MDVVIAREEDYRNDLRKHFDSILSGRLMQINPKTSSYEDILSWITDFDGSLGYINNACSWVIIGEIGTSSYNGHDFKYINFKSGDESAFSINFSQFIYPMSLKDSSTFPVFSSNEAKYYCTVDFKTIDPQEFFKSNIGKKMLYIYSFDCVTSFNSVKRCFCFALDKVSEGHLRDYIKMVQETVLKEFLQNPSQNAPSTTLVYNPDSSRPLYQHNCTSKITCEFSIKLFEEEYKRKKKKKLNELVV